MVAAEYIVVDAVSRETGELLRQTDAIQAYDDDQVYVLESKPKNE